MPSCSRRWSTRRRVCVRATPASAKPTSSNASPRSRPGGSPPRRSSRCRSGSWHPGWWCDWCRAWNGAAPPNGPPSNTAPSRIDSSPVSTRWPPHLVHRSMSVSSTGRSRPNPNGLGADQAERGARPVRRGWRTPSVHRARRVRQDHRAARRRGRPARRRPPRGRVGTDPSGGRRAARRRSRRPHHRPVPRRTPGPADTSRHDRDRRRDLTSRYS